MTNHKGFGDTVAALTELVGIKKTEDCGCQKRQEWLNKKLPYIIGYKNTQNKK